MATAAALEQLVRMLGAHEQDLEAKVFERT